MLQRKAASAGGGVIEIKTRHTRLSQFDHTTGEYIKKPLSQRVHGFGDGRTEPVQRDLYSAFLATCCDTNLLDIPQVKIAWASAEPLLRTAMSSVLQPASGKGFAQPHVGNGVRAGRRIKRVGPAVEAGDDVAPLRARQDPARRQRGVSQRLSATGSTAGPRALARCCASLQTGA
jgi:putative transposase